MMTRANRGAQESAWLERMLLAALVAAGLYIRLFHLSSPLLDTHSWRQTQTAMFARNFYRNGMNILKPQVDWAGAKPGYIESEFQLYPYTVALFYKVFGLDEKYGRLAAVFFSAGAMVFMYYFSRLFLDLWGASLALFFFVISPLNVFFSRAFMPESTMLFFSIGAVYFFTRWAVEDKMLWFWLSCGFSVFSFLVKIPSAHIGFALFYLAMAKYSWGMFAKKRLWLYLVVSLGIPALWYAYAFQLGKQSGLTENIWSIGQDKWGNAGVWKNPYFYKVMLNRISFGIVTYAGIMMAMLGFFIKTKHRYEPVTYVWLLSVVIYFYVVAYGNMVHSYYQLPLVPAASFFAAKGCRAVYELLKNNFVLKYNEAILALSLVFLAYCGYASYRDISPAYRLNLNMLASAYETNKVTLPGTLIVACDTSYPEVLYYSDRKGWHINPEETKPEDLQALVKEGAGALVISDAQSVYQNSAWRAFLETRTVLKKEGNFAILKL